ncbi:DUF397 domain-containing protein [Actinomadura barringtoniae]|uniref:DUF397 domain-containing protein n=1 Tax=Actinomadura barringtoniae TaxID=1427535 RepID=A0A939T4R0_9ACTN|nr:DUF397 domain-containing protein [Actinomadura barringtoniae]MBO2449708.1 DUF397 domain-containing protein [Actinomadura barringtoniae]
MTRPDPSHSAWRKSTHSDAEQATCVEVAQQDHRIAVRDSMDPDGPRLSLSGPAWRAFLSGIKSRA